MSGSLQQRVDDECFLLDDEWLNKKTRKSELAAWALVSFGQWHCDTESEVISVFKNQICLFNDHIAVLRRPYI